MASLSLDEGSVAFVFVATAVIDVSPLYLKQGYNRVINKVQWYHFDIMLGIPWYITGR